MEIKKVQKPKKWLRNPAPGCLLQGFFAQRWHCTCDGTLVVTFRFFTILFYTVLALYKIRNSDISTRGEQIRFFPKIESKQFTLPKIRV